MLTLNQKVRVDSQVVDTPLNDGEVVLLHLEDKHYYSLNLTGQRIWLGLKQGLTLREISKRVQEEFDVEADRADRCVLDLANEICEHQLAHPHTT